MADGSADDEQGHVTLPLARSIFCPPCCRREHVVPRSVQRRETTPVV